MTSRGRERPLEGIACIVKTVAETSVRATMIERRSFDRLPTDDRGWLKARHHFSCAAPHDPSPGGWGCLRGWNDEEIAPNAGFALEKHANVEIITYVCEGTVTHRDGFGSEGRVKSGSVQVLSAGTGIRHGEYNLEQVPARIFRLWIAPAAPDGAAPGQPTTSPEASRFVALAMALKMTAVCHPSLRPRAEGQIEGWRDRRIHASRAAARLPRSFVGGGRRERHENSRPGRGCDQERRRHHRHGGRGRGRRDG